MNFVICLLASVCIFFSGATLAAYESARLGTLFTDKTQRARIDAARSGTVVDRTAPRSSKVKINGYVTRSNGKNVVWIDNKNTLKSTRVNNIKVYASSIKNNKVTIRVDGKTARLKPGESWYKETGKIVDEH